MERISSKDNPKIKLFQKLMSGKKYRREQNMFVLEGLRLCLDGTLEHADFHCVFITETAEEKYGELLEPLYREYSEKIIPITDDLGEKMSDTSGTQGVFAICKTLDKSELRGTIKNGGKFIILNNLQDPGNMGTIIRTADAVGINALILCGCCDLYNPKVVRSTMGSLFRIPAVEADYAEAIGVCREEDIPVYASVIDSDADDLTDVSFRNGGAVVIGNEGNGLSREDAELCDGRLTIRMKGNVNSLNAAMATGIIMWEMLR